MSKSGKKRVEGLKTYAKGAKNVAQSGVQIAQGVEGQLDAVRSLVTGRPITAIKKAAQSTFEIGRGIVNSVKGAVQGIVGIAKAIFNHPEWYSNYPLEGLVNINFGRRKGVIEDALPNGYQVSTLDKHGVANSMVLYTTLVKPISQLDDWNQGIQYLYSTIRSANAGSVNYTPYDLERYLLDVRNIHAIYCMMRRAYALFRNVSLYDGTLPESIFRPMGIDYNDWIKNVGDLRATANLMSIQISKLLPIKCDLLERTRWMFSFGFADSNDAKHTPMFFNMYKFFDFKNNSWKNLLSNDFDSLTSYSSFINVVRKYLNDLTKSDVYNIIAGDIIRAFGESAVYPSEIWDENMAVPIVYDEAALTQIQNASVTDANVAITTSNTDYADYNITVTTADKDMQNAFTYDAPLITKCVINSYKDSITPAEAISFTRLAHTLLYEKTEDGVATYKMTSCGTELIQNIYYCTRSLRSDNTYKTMYCAYDGPNSDCIKNCKLITYSGLAGDGLDGVASLMSNWSQVDYGPLLRVIISDIAGEEDSTDIGPTLFDFNNYAVVDAVELRQLHGYAALSLLAVPRLARVNKTELIKG